MSYDLEFYAKKGDNNAAIALKTYLDDNFGQADNNQWFYENEDTGVYFYFERNEDDENEEEEDAFEFEGYDKMGFSFAINYMRPDFFGIEAFNEVDKVFSSLDNIYLYNIQGGEGDGEPYRPTPGALYQSWSALNTKYNQTEKADSKYYLSEIQSKWIWEYNFNRKNLQEKLGDNIFVPKIFFCKNLENEVVSVCVWPQAITQILPEVDYVLIFQTEKKLFRKREFQRVIAYNVLMDTVGIYFKNYELNKCKILTQNGAASALSSYNKLAVNYPTYDVFEGIHPDQITHYKK